MSDLVTAEQWGAKKKVCDLKLPSGATITVKENRLYALSLANILPLNLLEGTLKNQNGDTRELGIKEKTDMMKGIKQLVPLIQQIVVEPKIVLDQEPGKGEISFVDIPDDDIGAIIRYVMGSSEGIQLKSFRNVRSGTHSRQDGTKVSSKAV